MEHYKNPMDVGTIFERTVDLIGKTFVRNITVTVIFLFLPIVLLTVAANDFYAGVFELEQNGIAGAEQNLDTLIPFFTRFAFFIISTIIFTVGSLLAEMAVIQIVAGEINENPISYPGAIARTFDKKWIRGIGEEMLKIFAVGGGAAVLGIAAAILGAIFGSGDGGAFSMIMIFFMVLFVLPAIIYIFIAWTFGLYSISINDTRIVESLRESWNLVRGHWWRTFGILMLLMIITQFIVMIISTPFTFGTMWDVYKEFFTLLNNSKGDIDPNAFQKIQGSLGTGIGIGTGIGVLIRLMITPVFTCVMFYDLRSRQNRIAEPEQAPQTLTPPSQEM
jgi:hypothetical protein